MDLETTTDEFSSDSTTTSEEDSTSTGKSDSSIEVMGLTCNSINKVNSPKLQSQVKDVKRFQLPLWQEIGGGESKVVLTTAWQVTLGEMLKQRDALVVYWHSRFSFLEFKIVCNTNLGSSFNWITTSLERLISRTNGTNLGHPN